MEELLNSAGSLLTMRIPSAPTNLFSSIRISSVPLHQFCILGTLLALCAVILNRLRHSTFLSTAALRALRQGGPIPTHVAFIMDGNRRWARKGGLPAHQGHPHGGEKLIESLQWCLEAGVQIVTVYAFSIENFKRPQVEIDEIMQLALRKFHTLADRAEIIHANHVRVRVLGDLSRIPPDLRAVMAQVMEDTAHYSGGPTLNICFAYTARYDIASAVYHLATLCHERKMQPGQISESAIAACLSTGYASGAEPQESYPQLLVRTSGETRLSDFLLWEASDAILSFCPVLWPDLTTWNFVNLLLDYQVQCAARLQGRLRRGKQRECRDCYLWEEGLTEGEIPLESPSEALNNARGRYFKEIAAYCERESNPSNSSEVDA